MAEREACLPYDAVARARDNEKLDRAAEVVLMQEHERSLQRLNRWTQEHQAHWSFVSAPHATDGSDWYCRRCNSRPRLKFTIEDLRRGLCVTEEDRQAHFGHSSYAVELEPGYTLCPAHGWTGK